MQPPGFYPGLTAALMFCLAGGALAVAATPCTHATGSGPAYRKSRPRPS